MRQQDVPFIKFTLKTFSYDRTGNNGRSQIAWQ